MIDSELNHTIGRELEILSRKKNKQIILVLGMVLLLFVGFQLLKPSITGFITIEKQINYSDTINLEFDESSEYMWIPGNDGTLKSLRLSGSYKIGGNIKVYLEGARTTPGTNFEGKGNRYLIFDSDNFDDNSFVEITGLIVSNESISKKSY